MFFDKLRTSQANPEITPECKCDQKIGLIKRLWFFLLRNQVVIAIGSLIWLLLRSGSQPRRMMYPCQQAAAANVGAWSFVILPSALVDSHCRRHHYHRPAGRKFARRALVVGRTVFAASLVFMTLWAAGQAYEYARNALDPKVPAIMADKPMRSATGPLSSRLLSPSPDEAIVAFRRDPNEANFYPVTYCPVSDMPYDQADNPAYDLVWRAVADLHLGPYDNPLSDLISPGDKVLLKPNVVQERNYDCPPPAFVRPIVDMCAIAGASKITIADGNREPTFLVFDAQGYTQSYIDALDAIWPEVTIRRADLHDRSDWRWVTLGTDSAYEGSSYTDINSNRYDDVCPGYVSTKRDLYFGTPGSPRSDTVGVENTGNIIRWWAVNNYIFDSDVIINIPKMKVHVMNVNTIAMKNWVGVTLINTYPEVYYGQNLVRISHHRRNPAATNWQKSGFGNDLMWRDLGDLQRATFYWQGHGQPLSLIPLRKYLVICDGIWGGESNGGSGYSGYYQGAVMASVDPVALDCVGSRLMCYNWRPTEISPGEWRGGIPAIHNQQFVAPDYPLGTSDAGEIRVVGDNINRQVNRAINPEFDYHDGFDPNRTWPDWDLTTMTDLIPPEILSVELAAAGGQTGISVEIADDDAVTVYAYYGSDSSAAGAPYCEGLVEGQNNTWIAALPDNAGEVTVIAQDFNLNTSSWSNNAAIDGFENNSIESSEIGDVQDQLTGHGSWWTDTNNPQSHAGWFRIPEAQNPNCAVEIVENGAAAAEGERFMHCWGWSDYQPWMWKGFDLTPGTYNYQLDLHFKDIDLFRLILMNCTSNPTCHRFSVEIWFEGWNDSWGHENNFPYATGQDGEIWVNDNSTWRQVGYWKGPQASGGNDAEQGWVRVELRNLTAPTGPDDPGSYELVWGGTSLGTYSTWWDGSWTPCDPVFNLVDFHGGIVHSPVDDTKGVFIDNIAMTAQGFGPTPPDIAEVTPELDTVIAETEYTKQLTLLHGTPPVSWSVLQGPQGLTVDQSGYVSGWTPGLEDIGQTFNLEIEASNSQGSDTESWQVRVYSQADFDADGDVDQEDFGKLQACLSGSSNPCEAGCEEADLNNDGDVDQGDLDTLQVCMAGANNHPGC